MNELSLINVLFTDILLNHCKIISELSEGIFQPVISGVFE